MRVRQGYEGEGYTKEKIGYVKESFVLRIVRRMSGICRTRSKHGGMLLKNGRGNVKGKCQGIRGGRNRVKKWNVML